MRLMSSMKHKYTMSKDKKISGQLCKLLEVCLSRRRNPIIIKLLQRIRKSRILYLLDRKLVIYIPLDFRIIVR